jgi:hypothetical protein
VRRGEDLRDAAAAVVANEVHLTDLQRIEKLPEHLGVGGHGHVLLRRDLAVAMRQQVHRDAASDVG